MNDRPLASIIISSYNYGRFLKDCIDSALNQTYPETEVIVVDDASGDDSREIIGTYANRIKPILRERNEGGRATYNAVCRLSRGEVIVILDSDDMLCPTAIECAVARFRDPDVVKVHWPLWEINTHAQRTGRLDPCRVLPDGDLRKYIARDGPWGYAFPSTSGNAYSRRFLERTLPVPSGTYGDAYLSMWALVTGTIRSVREPQGFYRIHGHNTYGGRTFDQRVELDLRHAEHCLARLRTYYQEQGAQVDTDAWKKESWYHRLYQSALDIKAQIPDGDTFVLVDQDNWATSGWVAGRRALPFPESNGEFGGSPADDAAATEELERRRRSGAAFIVFAWQAFWWLDYYTGFKNYLETRFPCLMRNERLIIFDLRSSNRAEAEV